jgi:hypothetical protein
MESDGDESPHVPSEAQDGNAKQEEQMENLMEHMMNRFNRHGEIEGNENHASEDDGLVRNALSSLEFLVLSIVSQDRKRHYKERAAKKKKKADEKKKKADEKKIAQIEWNADLQKIISNVQKDELYSSTHQELVDMITHKIPIKEEKLKEFADVIYNHFPPNYYHKVPMFIATDLLEKGDNMPARKQFCTEYGEQIKGWEPSTSNLNSAMNITTSREQKSSDARPSAPPKSSVMELLDDYEF